MRVTLTPVVETEYEDFFALLEPYHRELDGYEAPTADTTSAQDYRRATLADMHGRELLWFAVDGERAGLAIVLTLPDWPDGTRQVATILEFYVAPEQRRRGVGRAAVEALLAEHRGRGTALVEAGILSGNQPAQAFWAELGFQVRSLQTARRP